MANADAPFGFRPINRDGGPYNGQTIRCVIAAADTTSTFIGDPVRLDGSGSDGYAGVSQVATGESVYGVVTAFEANPDGLSDQYRKASTKRFCQVAIADGNYFEVQENGADDALLAADVGLNANFSVVAGSTVYGNSNGNLTLAQKQPLRLLICK